MYFYAQCTPTTDVGAQRDRARVADIGRVGMNLSIVFIKSQTPQHFYFKRGLGRRSTRQKMSFRRSLDYGILKIEFLAFYTSICLDSAVVLSYIILITF